MLKFLLIIVCGYFIIRMLGRVFIVSSFNSINQRMQEEMRNRQQQQKPEGQITIDPGVPNKRNQNDNDGDFIDYEEVK